MIDVVLQVLPFFALIGIGAGAGASGMFDAGAGRVLTRFVFYFALSALLFRFASGLDLGALFDWRVLGAYASASLAVYALAFAVATRRGVSLSERAVEAQCAVVGNVGFLGLPMLTMLLGEGAALPILQVLTVDLLLFAALIVTLFSIDREGRIGPGTLLRVGQALVRNPMLVAIFAGFAWAATGMALPAPVSDLMTLLGDAATPGALFAIGVSLVQKNAERLSVATWLSTCKLVLHPLAVALAALVLFPVPDGAARVVIATAALPVAGNVFILAQSYGVAPQRVSTAILISTIVSIATLTLTLALTT